MSKNCHWKCSMKKTVLIGKNLNWSLFFNKAVPIQLFCEYCEIFKNTYFEEHLQMNAPEYRLQQQ